MAQWEEARLHGSNLNLDSNSAAHFWESGSNQFTSWALISSYESWDATSLMGDSISFKEMMYMTAAYREPKQKGMAVSSWLLYWHDFEFFTLDITFSVWEMRCYEIALNSVEVRVIFTFLSPKTWNGIYIWQVLREHLMDE